MKIKVYIYKEVCHKDSKFMYFDRILRLKHIPRIGEEFKYISSFLSNPETKSKEVEGKVLRVVYDNTKKKEKIVIYIK